MTVDMTKDMTKGVTGHQSIRVRNWTNLSDLQKTADSSHSDLVAEEVPVAMVYNGISHAVMMASPLDLEAFAIGFSLTEGIVDRGEDVYGVEVVSGTLGIELAITISNKRFMRLKEHPAEHEWKKRLWCLRCRVIGASKT